MGDGAQQRWRESEREARERERREMEAPEGIGGKSIRAHENERSNLRWRRINFPVQPTCHVIESFPTLLS